MSIIGVPLYYHQKGSPFISPSISIGECQKSIKFYKMFAGILIYIFQICTFAFFFVSNHFNVQSHLRLCRYSTIRFALPQSILRFAISKMVPILNDNTHDNNSPIWHNMPQVKFICSLSYEKSHFEVWNYLFKFYKMFDSIPIYIFSNDISMFFSQVKQNCWSIWSVVVITDQAVVNNAFVFCKVPIKLIFCPEKGSSRLSCFYTKFLFEKYSVKIPLPEFRVTLVTFVIFDTKMHLQMPFVMVFIFITIGAVLTLIKIIIMNPHMFFQFGFCCKTWLTIWLRTFVPKLFIRTHRMHFSMKI